MTAIYCLRSFGQLADAARPGEADIASRKAQALRFVLGHTGLKAGLAERFRAIVNIFQNGGEVARELIETRCHRGADIARKMRFAEPD